MRVVEIAERFGVDSLRVGERPEPEARPGQVVVRVHAASLNYRDWLVAQGLYNPRLPLPLIPCSDGAGEVVAVGDGVSRVRQGERVATLFAQRWISGEPTREKLRSTLGGPLDGTLSELMALDAEGVVHVPAHLTDEEAATLPCAALTAWSALVTHGGVTAGDTVLLQGTGGVSTFALQLAGILGARAIVISGSDEKLVRARELGAWQTINYERTPDWGERAKRLAGNGVDLVLDVGGARTLGQSMIAVRMGGRISQVGMLSGSSTPLDVIPIHMRQIRIQGILVGHREGFEAMNRAIATHGLRPVIDRVFDLTETRAAFDHLAGGRHLGKICVRIQ